MAIDEYGESKEMLEISAKMYRRKTVEAIARDIYVGWVVSGKVEYWKTNDEPNTASELAKTALERADVFMKATEEVEG